MNDHNIGSHYASDNTVLARYYHGPVIDELLCRVTETNTVYYHHDGLGSTVALTDSTGNVVESYTYDVYGQPFILSVTYHLLPTSSVTNRFLFTGREYLADLALYDYRHRFYSPSLGRFLQTDPLRFDAGDVNLYRYVENLPTFLRDAFGLAAAQQTKPGDDVTERLWQVALEKLKNVRDAEKFVKTLADAVDRNNPAKIKDILGLTGKLNQLSEAQTKALGIFLKTSICRRFMEAAVRPEIGLECCDEVGNNCCDEIMDRLLQTKTGEWPTLAIDTACRNCVTKACGKKK